jgi:hypothetical protein
MLAHLGLQTSIQQYSNDLGFRVRRQLHPPPAVTLRNSASGHMFYLCVLHISHNKCRSLPRTSFTEFNVHGSPHRNNIHISNKMQRYTVYWHVYVFPLVYISYDLAHRTEFVTSRSAHRTFTVSSSWRHIMNKKKAFSGIFTTDTKSWSIPDWGVIV